MIIFIFLLAVTAASEVEVSTETTKAPVTDGAIVETEPPCFSCFLLNKTCYNMSYLFNLDAPFRKQVVITKMGLLRSKNILYFSFEPTFEDEEYYKTGFVNLDDLSSHGIITGSQILNLGTFGIDQTNGQIFFGGSDGIFVLDTNTNQMGSYSSRGDTITNVFYKNQVYFVRYEDKGIIVKQGNYFKTMLEYWTVKKFVVVEKQTINVIVFLSNTGLFITRGKIIHRLSKNAYFRGLTVDLDGEVYAWWIDGIYKVIIADEIIHSKIEKVANLPLIGAMTFDNNNNILIASDRSLYLMAKTNHSCGVIP